MPGSDRTPRPLVIQTEDLDASAAQWLRESCEVVACSFRDQPRFDELLLRAEGVVVRTYTTVNDRFLDRAPKLRVVGRAGVGLDRIDVSACRARGVEVVHTPDANTQAVAEYVFAMLHDAVRPRLFLQTAITLDRWTGLRRELEAPNQVSELTLGILGMGRVGQRVARIAHGFDMDVLYHDLIEIPKAKRHGAQPAPLDEMLRKCNVLTIHVDSRPSNKRLVDRTYFDRLPDHTIIINTSRGFIVDDLALAAYLRDHPSAKALLDVHEPEPFQGNYPLLGLPNAHLSPHLAASTATAHQNMSWVVKDVLRVLKGQKPVFAAP
jgi:D-3-phosphoglycerate dehydrogenase